MSLNRSNGLFNKISNKNIISNEIKEHFLSYFEKNGHKRIPSSSIIPLNDPSLLFTNAGMVPLKENFINLMNKNNINKRITSCQRCIRVGGKDNDLNQIGFSNQHVTYFQMLGNFSFNDYFKEEAIYYAWNYLIKELQFKPNHLRITIHKNDKESYTLWKKIGHLNEKKQIIQLNDIDNFWTMGKIGPCGPCSEIFYDLKSFSNNINEDKRWLEIWNLVFMMYNKKEKNNNIIIENLPYPCVDTGMGLERIQSIIENKISIYDIYYMKDLLYQIATILDKKSKNGYFVYTFNTELLNNNYFSLHDKICTLRMIMDHSRTIVIMILDGILPSNTGRGYVLRKIIRRALRYGYKYDIHEPFLYNIIQVIYELSHIDISYENKLNYVKNMVYTEELAFIKTLKNGLKEIEKVIDHLKKNNINSLSGIECYKLYDTFGLPLDIIEMIASENGIKVDSLEFNKILKTNIEITKKKSKSFISEPNYDVQIKNIFTKWKQSGKCSKFIGYDTFSMENCSNSTENIVFDIQKDPKKSNYWILLEKSIFYPKGGGQVGDQGIIKLLNRKINTIKEFKVIDTIKPFNNGIAILIQETEDIDMLSSNFFCNTTLPSDYHIVFASIDKKRRLLCSMNHTATHLLHKALKIILGKTINQKGSYVDDNKLHFDYNYIQPLQKKEIKQIESYINNISLSNAVVKDEYLTKEEALKRPCIGLFEDTYNDIVRMIHIEENDTKDIISNEICIGTHLKPTKDIFPFVILNDKALSANIRRIEAVCGPSAVHILQNRNEILHSVGEILHSPITNIIEKTKNMSNTIIKTESAIQAIIDHMVYTEKNNKSKNKIYTFPPLKENILIDISNGNELSCVSCHLHLLDFPKNKHNHILNEFESNYLKKMVHELQKIHLKNKNNKDIHIIILNNQIICISNNKNIHMGCFLQKIIHNGMGKGGGSVPFAKGILSCTIFNLKNILKDMMIDK